MIYLDFNTLTTFSICMSDLPAIIILQPIPVLKIHVPVNVLLTVII